MSLKSIFTVSLLLLFFAATAQKYDCGWHGNKSTEERNSLFPFNKTEKIVLISYLSKQAVFKKSDYLPDEDKESLIRRLYPYEYVFNTNTKEHIYHANAKVEINDFRIEKLSHILINYTLKEKTGGRYVITETKCYDPKNAILFLDKENKIISVFEICFECFSSHLNPDPDGINFYTQIYECWPKLELLKEFLIENGIAITD